MRQFRAIMGFQLCLRAASLLLANPDERAEMKKFIAQVDPELRDLIPGFLANKHNDTLAILCALSSEKINFEAISRIGHKLKGEGGSYGLEAISVYGAEIEQAATSHDAEAIHRYANELAAYLDSVQIEYT
jgi:HPt (histidine-containing phosphotransfer) domain-containing protein